MVILNLHIATVSPFITSHTNQANVRKYYCDTLQRKVSRQLESEKFGCCIGDVLNINRVALGPGHIRSSSDIVSRQSIKSLTRRRCVTKQFNGCGVDSVVNINPVSVGIEKWKVL